MRGDRVVLAEMANIIINIAEQSLLLTTADGEHHYAVSTALNGPGELEGSECTPRGRHQVAAKIGGGLALGAVLLGRRPSGELCDAALQASAPTRDWILSRILWLEGCEVGINRGHNADGQLVDTMQRYIYIHGTPDSEPMGQAKSHGCIRMRNADIVDLYSKIEPGTPVEIKES